MHANTMHPQNGDIGTFSGEIGDAGSISVMNATGLPRMAGWWHELICRDRRAAVTFYGRVLGWRFEEIRLTDGSSYHLAWQDGRAMCGVLQLEPRLHGDLPDHWMGYMRTPDLEVTLRAACLAGGEILRAPVMVPPIGRLALIADAGGAILGVMEATHETGQMADNTTRG